MPLQAWLKLNTFMFVHHYTMVDAVTGEKITLKMHKVYYDKVAVYFCVCVAEAWCTG